MDDKKEEIKKLRKMGFTLQEIGNQLNPKLCKERVRQILLPVNHKMKFCKKHRRKYSQECILCEITKAYSITLNRMGLKQLIEEANRISKYPYREKDVVICKSLLIKKMKDSYKVGFEKLGQLLNLDYSSIRYLYYRKV